MEAGEGQEFQEPLCAARLRAAAILRLHLFIVNKRLSLRSQPCDPDIHFVVRLMQRARWATPPPTATMRDLSRSAILMSMPNCDSFIVLVYKRTNATPFYINLYIACSQ